MTSLKEKHPPLIKQAAIKQAAKERRKLLTGVEKVGGAEVTVSPPVAALMMLLPQDVLRKSGVLSVPAVDQFTGEKTVSITVDTDSEAVVRKALAWEQRDEIGQLKVLAKLYEPLFTLVQAQSPPAEAVDLNQMIAASSTLLKEAAQNLVPLEGVVDFFQQNPKARLPELDTDGLAGLARVIFRRLQATNNPDLSEKVKGWQRQGLTPDNLFSAWG